MKAEKVLRIGQPGNRFKRVLEGCTELSIDINFIGFGHDAYSVKRASIFCVFYLRIKCIIVLDRERFSDRDREREW